MEYTVVLTYEHVNCVRSWNFVGGGHGRGVSKPAVQGKPDPPCESLATRELGS